MKSLILVTLLSVVVAPLAAEEIEPPVDCRDSKEHLQFNAQLAFLEGLDAFDSEAAGEPTQASSNSHFRRALECNPEHGSARYWLGLTLLEQGRFSDAARQLARSRRSPQKPRTHRWRIMAHLAAARQLNGEHRRARRAARKALKLAQETEASDICNAESDSHLLGFLRQLPINSETPLPSIEACDLGEPRPEPREPRWNGVLSLLAGRDSNPNILDDNLIVRTPDDRAVSGKDADGSSSLKLYLAANSLINSDSWHLGLSWLNRVDAFSHFDHLNMIENRVTMHLSKGNDPLHFLSGPLGSTRVPYGHDRFSWLLQLGYLHTHLGDVTYFEGFEAAATWVWRPMDVSATQVEFLLRDRNFDATIERDQSTKLWTLDASQFFFIRLRDRYLRLGLRFGNHDGDRFYSRALLEPYLEVAMPLGKGWNLRFTASQSLEEYDHSESNLFLTDATTAPRDDTTLRGRLDVAWVVRRNLQFVLALYFTERDSELELPEGLAGLSYRRAQTTAGLRWKLF